MGRRFRFLSPRTRLLKCKEVSSSPKISCHQRQQEPFATATAATLDNKSNRTQHHHQHLSMVEDFTTSVQPAA